MANTHAPDAGSTVTPSASVGSSAPPIDAEIGALFGDLTEEEDRDESPAPSTPDAGTPPAEGSPAAPVETPQAGAESATPSPAAGAPPAGTDGASALDTTLTETPLTYTVNGETRTFEGLQLLGDQGAFITPEHLPKLIRVLTERDNLFERDQERYQQQQGWERERAELNRLTEWKQGDQTLQGPDGILAQRASAAGITAALQTLVQAFKENPVRYLSQDEQGNIIWNPEAIERLTLRSQIAERGAVDAVRSQFQTVRSQAHEQATQTQQEAPQEIWRQVHEAWVAPHAAALTEKDQQFLATQMPFYLRNATPQEIAAGSMRRVVDASFQQVITDRANLRAEQAKTAAATQTAATANAAKLAAAALGTASKPAPVAAPATATTTARSQQAKDDALAWRMRENAAMGRFTHSTE